MTNDDLVDAGLEINQILGHADALISDYSSAAVDYLVLDRPEAFTLDDVEVYEKRRLLSGKMQKWANDCNCERVCSALGIGNSSDC